MWGGREDVVWGSTRSSFHVGVELEFATAGPRGVMVRNSGVMRGYGVSQRHKTEVWG